MVGWSPLLRRLLRVLAGAVVREVIRHGRRAAGAPGGGASEQRPTVIDLQRADPDRPFERFSEEARRSLAVAVDRQGGPHLGSEALLLALIESHRGTAAQLAQRGTDVHALRSDLRRAVRSTAARRGGPDPEVRRALRAAGRGTEPHDRRPVEPQDLLKALLSEDPRIADVVRGYTVGALDAGQPGRPGRDEG